jgi:FecR-like protein
MRQIIRFLAATILGVASFAPSAPLFAQQGYVHEVSGNVFGHVGAGQAARVEKGQTLSPNTTVTTEAKSYAVLKFEDGTVVLLKENTSFQVQSYTYNPKAPDNSNAVFNLLRGGLRMVTGLVTSRNRDAMRVATPHATIGIRGTEFTAELVNPLFVATQVGVISLTNAAGTMLVAAGQAASVLSATTLPSLVSLTQLPAGVLNFPKVPLPPATPAPITGAGGAGTGGAVGGGAAGATAGAAGAAVVGGAVAAGVAASSNNQSTTTHH